MPAPQTPSLPPAPEPLEDINLFSSNAVVAEAAAREGASGAIKRLSGFGLMTGSSGTAALGRAANRNRPHLTGFDRSGQPLNQIAYHPAFLDLFERAAIEGLRTPLALSAPAKTGAAVERAAQIYMAVQTDAGHIRAITMGHAALAVINPATESGAAWTQALSARSFDAQDSPLPAKHSANAAVSLLSCSAGPELYAASSSRNAAMTVTGLVRNVWMPDADLIVACARAVSSDGLVAIPRFRADGTRNTYTIRALNPELGLVSAARADIAFDGAEAFPADANDGLNAALMHQRLDGATAIAGLMHRATAEAIHHSRFGFVTGMSLGQRALTQHVLADLALDVEAAVALVFRLARAFDRASDARAAAWRRLMTPVGAYLIAKMAPALVAEASEVFGPAAGSETWPAARLTRDAMALNWFDHSGTGLTLEVLHVLQREPAVMEQVMTDLGEAAAGEARLKSAHGRIEALLQEPRYLDGRGRLLVESLGLLAAAVLLKAHAPHAISEAYIVTRLGPHFRRSYGQGLDWSENDIIIARALADNA